MSYISESIQLDRLFIFCQEEKRKMNDIVKIEFNEFEIIYMRLLVKDEIERLKRVREMFSNDKRICELQEKHLEEYETILAKLS